MGGWRAFAVLGCALLCQAAPAAGGDSRSGHFATGDGVRLHYLDVGSGPLLVFVPGWMVPGWMWEPQIRHFSQAFRVIALDPRSQGESEPVTEGHYPERRAQDIRDLVTHLGAGPALVVGHSMAVGELLAYVHQFGTADLAGLVLVDASLGPEPKPGEAAEFFAFAGAIARDREGFIEEARPHYYRRPPPAEYWQRLVDDVLRVPNTTGLAMLLGSAGVDFSPALAKIDKPLLYAITPQFKEEGDMLRSKVRGARVEIFEESGHVLFIDEADKFNRVLEEFAHEVFARQR